jgi:cytochrome c553
MSHPCPKIHTRLTTALLGGLAALLLASPASAGDIEAGRVKSQMCMVCHGQLGLSVRPDAPNIAGHPEIYLLAKLRDYRSGTRRNEIMNVIAKDLSDLDIANLAAWYSAIRVEAQAPR